MWLEEMSDNEILVYNHCGERYSILSLTKTKKKCLKNVIKK